MHMCFISLGRYLGIRNPLKTRASSKKAVVTKIVLVWLVSMSITSPITVLAMVDATNIKPATGVCAINNRFFFVFGSMFAFYVPMVIMVVTYVLTVRLLKRKAKFLAEKPSRRVPFIRRTRRASLTSPESSSKNGHVQSATYCRRCQTEVSNDTKGLLNASPGRDTREIFTRSRTIRHSQNHHHQHSFQQHHQQLLPGMVRTLGTNQVMNEQKATKVLGIVFFSFVICWTPFFLLNILFAVKRPEDFPSYLATTFLWLGYVSSTINPIIYTVFNKNFKRAFWKLLTCKCRFVRHANLHSTNDLTSWTFKSTNHYPNKPGSPSDPYHESMC